MRKQVFAQIVVLLAALMLTACGAENADDVTVTQPAEATQALDTGRINLQEEWDISTFEKAMALWNTYADQAEPQPDGPLELEFAFPSQNIARIWRFDADDRFGVQLYEPSDDYWQTTYSLDGTILLQMAQETNPDGTYVTLEEILNNPEDSSMIRCTYAADGTALNKVERWNNSWTVCYYGEHPEKLTTEEQVKEILKAAYSKVDISQQEYYTLSFLVSTEDKETDPYSYARHADGSTLIVNVVDQDNYYHSTWVDGEQTECEEQRTTNGYYYYFWSKEVECTVEGNEGVAHYPNDRQITFKVLIDENGGAKGYPLTERTAELDVDYHYVDANSPYCDRVNVKDHKTGDQLIFAMDPVPSEFFQDTYISVDWTHNGVTTHYDRNNNPLGAKVYDIPWYPDMHLMVPWVNPPCYFK